MNKEISAALKFNGKLKVCEIFKTIQGEGPSTGIPAVFLRLSLCNLACIWCDSPYTWNWDGTGLEHEDQLTGENKKYDPRAEITEMTANEVFWQVYDLAGPVIKTIVITGGEPLIHRKLPAFQDLLRRFKDEGFRIEIETNGTLVPGEEIEPFIDQFNVSPKLENSNNSKLIRERPAAYKFFSACPKALFKFVVAAHEDIDEIYRLEVTYNISADKILLMPEGRTDEETRTLAKELVQVCLNCGYRFCNRLHVWVWGGAIRGV